MNGTDLCPICNSAMGRLALLAHDEGDIPLTVIADELGVSTQTVLTEVHNAN